MQLCIFYLLTVRRQENKVFSAAFAAENTRLIEIIIIIQENRIIVFFCNIIFII
jgi:hypothetical protein